MVFSTAEKSARHVDDLLDEAVADSFPASDPVSLAMPHRRDEAPGAGAAGAELSTLLLIGGGILAVIALLALRR